ncbi:hypothetical protein T484DRAFT_1885069 [Baffinella frigidus]|nr:hypothetical protein T484DRAFT_1885069 [Cryptophyta sp. CCMP2293]
MHASSDDGPAKAYLSSGVFDSSIQAHGPVLFLDVDGVLHPLNGKSLPSLATLEDLSARADDDIADTDDSGTGEAVDGEFVDSEEFPCMSAFASVVRQTQARIVLSSTWRETARGRRCVDAQLERQGMPASIGCTPRFNGGRPKEILAWVAKHRLTGGWVAVDDLDMGGKLPPGHFVKTDPRRGFTKEDGARVCAMLAAQQGAGVMAGQAQCSSQIRTLLESD